MPRQKNRPKKNQPFTVAFVIPGVLAMKVDALAVKLNKTRSAVLRKMVEKSVR
jgi:hypothetical protein